MSLHHVAIDDAAWASPWRRRRVEEKTLFSVGLILTALFSPPWPGCILVGIVALFCMLGPARIRPRLVLGALTAPVVFVLIGTLPVALEWHGFDRGMPLRVTHQSLVRSGTLAAHSLSGTLALVLLATTTPMVDLLGWMRGLRIPDPLLELANLTYRLLFLLLGTTFAIREAQKARLVDQASFRRRWQVTAATMGSVMLTSWERARRLQEGLEARGYEETLPTLIPHRARSTRFLATTILVLVAIWTANLGWRLT